MATKCAPPSTASVAPGFAVAPSAGVTLCADHAPTTMTSKNAACFALDAKFFSKFSGPTTTTRVPPRVVEDVSVASFPRAGTVRSLAILRGDSLLGHPRVDGVRAGVAVSRAPGFPRAHLV